MVVPQAYCGDRCEGEVLQSDGPVHVVLEFELSNKIDLIGAQVAVDEPEYPWKEADAEEDGDELDDLEQLLDPEDSGEIDARLLLMLV